MTEGFTRQRALQVGRVAVHVAEAGDGPPVVLLHGNPDTHVVWRGLVAHLASGHRCLAPDLPGFGASPAPGDVDVTLAGMSRWVAELLDALELPRAHLVVHDVGTTYGLAFACEHPERLLTLTTFNGNFFPDYRWHFWARLWRTPLLGEIVMAFGNEWLFVRETKKGSPGVTTEQAREAYAAFTPRTRRHVLRLYREMDPERLAGWDRKLLATLATVPTLVLWGDLDPYIPSSTAEKFVGAEIRHFPDGGHWVMVDRPEEAAARIAAHIAGAGTGPGATP